MTSDKRPSHLFKPGQSGNPSGRSKASYHVAELAKKYTKEAISILGEILNNPKVPYAVRVSAAEALLNRGWGKPMISVQAQTTQFTFQDWIRERMEIEKKYQAAIASDTVEVKAIEVKDSAKAEVVEVKEAAELSWEDVL